MLEVSIMGDAMVAEAEEQSSNDENPDIPT